MNHRLKSIFVFIISLFTASAIGIIIPKVIFQDTKNISKIEMNCGKKAAYKIISENYIKNLLTTNVVVRDKKEQVIDGQNQSVIYTEAYTLFGIKLVTVTSLCDSKTKELMCAALVYKIWAKTTADPNKPCG